MSNVLEPSARALHATICGKLRRSGFKGLSGVRISGTGDCLRLSGTVSTYYAKAMAGALAINVPGVLRLENAIEVR